VEDREYPHPWGFVGKIITAFFLPHLWITREKLWIKYINCGILWIFEGFIANLNHHIWGLGSAPAY
jgi:hypothetical protein